MEDTNLSQAASGNVEKTRPQSGRRVAPPVDIFENSDGFLILADLPGVEPEGLTVEYNPPELHVSARVRGSDALVYERRFELGSGIDPAAINAELTQGVLRIELKKSAALRPRRIEVRAS
ncbi:MAG TPA: Hsp20/alpha crystallin family protein [Polyangiaceae bacterium]|nr:Hsp20/alpha crystallin family protein [Polyangiaceae bacterium]